MEIKKKKVDESWKQQVQQEKRKLQEQENQQAPPQGLPPANFLGHLMSLFNQALIQLGEVEHPLTKTQKKDLPGAKYTIDMLQVLQEKTKGNLTPEEEQALEQMLYELRMRFVRASQLVS